MVCGQIPLAATLHTGVVKANTAAAASSRWRCFIKVSSARYMKTVASAVRAAAVMAPGTTVIVSGRKRR